jgi:two-component system chemotaxis response regulator CheB
MPADFPGAVFVVQHLSPDSTSVLPRILSRAGPLPAHSPQDGEEIEHGRIYVAAPDHHMLIRPGRVLMRRGPVENRTRPAVDALFRSAAVSYGARVIGVVLTGVLDDGTLGLVAIKEAGGMSIVQDPEEAPWPSMPRHAIKNDHVDYVLRIAEMPELLNRLVREAAGLNGQLNGDIIAEDRIAELEVSAMGTEGMTPGQPSRMSCPDCGGVLNEIADQDTIRFRCQIGHAFTAVGLESAIEDQLEKALGVAMRTHRDRHTLFTRMADAAQYQRKSHTAERWQRAAADAGRLAGIIEQALGEMKRTNKEGE